MRCVALDRTQPDVWATARSMFRQLLVDGCEPREVTFEPEQTSLWGLERRHRKSEVAPSERGRRLSFPSSWRPMFRRVLAHRDGSTPSLLYRLLWRVQRLPQLVDQALDADVRELEARDATVRRDAHKAKAFIRFREIGEGRYAAWHRTEHFVLPLIAPFLARRFSDMQWLVVTPDVSVSCGPQGLKWGAGAPRSSVPDGDAFDELWRAYYRATFNPARLNLSMMKSEMPMKHWSTLPETRDLRQMIAEAPSRVASMASEARPSAESVMPPVEHRSLPTLRSALPACRACPLHEPATQGVFGEWAGLEAQGRMPRSHGFVVVGEQPGHHEDLSGRPFVGPAGTLLREIFAEVGFPLERTYLTNAVKHFRFRGKRRLHDRPRAGEVRACRPWLLAELEQLRPSTLVLLGSTATRSVLGRFAKPQALRGRMFPSPFAPRTLVTWHPSAVLRARERGDAIRSELRSHLALATREEGRASPSP